MIPRWSYRVFDCLKVVSTNAACLRFNHYKALGLTPSASLSDIKAAYYKLSKLHHPDRNNGSPTSAKKFREIVAAYEILSKSEARKKYDRELGLGLGVNYDYLPRKKGTKRHMKNSSSIKIKSTQFKNDHRTKSNYRNTNKFSKNITRSHNREFDTFLVRTLPLVIACLLCSKKR